MCASLLYLSTTPKPPPKILTPRYAHSDRTVQGELEAYHNLDERWRVVLRGAATIEMEANTPLEPDRTVTLGRGAALSMTCVDDQHAVQGASFRRKTGGGTKRGAPPGL
jgi:hypothetical protein